jgi:surfeit locus 1 family protein
MLPTLAVIVLLPLLVSLGFWQLDRAAQKRALLLDFERGSEAVVLAGQDGVARLGQLPRYQRVSLTGRFDGAHQFLIDNITDGGAAGYYVVTPFAPEGASTWVLVNRGWIRKDFGARSPPEVDVDESVRELTGRVARLPRPGLDLDDRPVTNTWPMVVQFPTVEELARTLERELAPVSVLLAPELEDGYLRRWRPTEIGPDTHIGYAVQWFALALTLAAIYAVLHFRRRRHD